MSYYVILDPSGYKVAGEPGIDMEWTGQEMFRRPLIRDGLFKGFWNPKGSEWLQRLVNQRG